MVAKLNPALNYKLKSRTVIWNGLAFLYLVIRFGFTSNLDSLGEFASYILEALLVAFSIILSWNSFRELFKFHRSIFLSSIGSLIFGFAIFKFAVFSNILIPFDLQGVQTIAFLLLISPILEELIFRFFLWKPTDSLTKRPFLSWVITSIVFSYSHLHAIWFAPKEIHPFVMYQTVYTLILGLSCGYFVYKHNSILGGMLIHFFFNLGFYLAFLVSI
jgi:membrane protease YdiL (CAAX protease family)